MADFKSKLREFLLKKRDIPKSVQVAGKVLAPVATFGEDYGASGKFFQDIGYTANRLVQSTPGASFLNRKLQNPNAPTLESFNTPATKGGRVAGFTASVIPTAAIGSNVAKIPALSNRLSPVVQKGLQLSADTRNPLKFLTGKAMANVAQGVSYNAVNRLTQASRGERVTGKNFAGDLALDAVLGAVPIIGAIGSTSNIDNQVAKQSIEQITEAKGNWAKGLREEFDQALFSKDAKKVKELLPSVPANYKKRFSKEIKELISSPFDVDRGLKNGLKERAPFEQVASGRVRVGAETVAETLKSPNRYYKPIKLETLAKETGNRITDESSVTEYIARVTNDNYKITAQDLSDGLAVYKQLDRNGQHETASNIFDRLTKNATEMGQANAVWKLWYSTTPIGKAKILAKTLNEMLGKQNKALTPEQTTRVYEIAKELDALKDDKSAYKQKSIEAFKEMSDMVPYTKGEFLKAVRYNGILSHPQTQSRNIFGNTLQTFFIRPVTKLGTGGFTSLKNYVEGASSSLKPTVKGQGFKKAVKSSPAVQIALEAWNDPTKLAIKNEENIGDTLPDLLKHRPYEAKGLARLAILDGKPTRLLEAADKFYTKIIADGEYQDLKARGFSEEDALNQAKGIAEKYLFRGRLDPKNETGQGALLSGIDAISSAINTLRQKRGGTWIVPFLNTPVQLFKSQLEYSPVGLTALYKNTNKREQLVKAGIGTGFSLIGAYLAASDRTAWRPPKDPKQRKLWYDSGKRPMSIKLGDRWIPMQYLGPLSLAVGLPAMVKHYTEDNNTALSDTALEKTSAIATDMMRWVVDQTPLSGLQSLANVVFDDDNFTRGSKAAASLAFISGQAVPGSGFMRYLTQVIDPVYRNANLGGLDEILKNQYFKNLPFLSKTVPAYETSTGEPSKRPWGQTFMSVPYVVGKNNPEFSTSQQERGKQMQVNALVNAMENAAENQDSSLLTSLQNRAESVKVGQPTPQQAKTNSDMLSSIKKRQEDMKKIGKVMENEYLSDGAKQKLLSTLGFGQADIQAWEDKKLTSLGTTDSADYVMSQPSPDFTDLYKRKILTSDVAKELENRGYITNADELMDKVKLIDPYYQRKEQEKIDEDKQQYAKEVTNAVISANKSVRSLLKTKSIKPLRTKGYSAKNFRRKSVAPYKRRVTRRPPKIATGVKGTPALNRLSGYK